MNIFHGLELGDKLDSDGELEIETLNDYEGTESKWIKREEAIKIARHLIELFKIDVEEVKDDLSN